MTLVEVCEPIFQYICQLNRSGADTQLDFQQLRQEFVNLLAQARNEATSDPALVGMWDETESILKFFIDYMIINSQLTIAMDWMGDRLAGGVQGNYIGDEAFFEHLDNALKDRSDSAQQKISVYYTCMGLGFEGKFQGEPEKLQPKINECANRIRGLMEMDQSANICPDAYEHTDDRPLFIKPTRSLVGMSIALVGMIVVLGITMVYLYYTESQNLNRYFERVKNAPSALLSAGAVHGGQAA